MGVKYNMKEVKPKDWIEAFNEEVSCHSDKLYKLLDEELELTQHELDTAADALTNAMKAATARVAPVHQPSARAKPWWDGQCSEALNRVQQAERAKRQHRMENGFTSEWQDELAKHEQNHFH
ncbi:hypothetical protein EV359DRAFT_87995 [Lentinula novae-zelandiae]|nr:hypothetical protein EV359DRAFT_87995 [Lentinula novae-zelandiae]